MSELVMGQEYLRIQIYFPKGEANLYRAIEALAKKGRVSMAAVARTAIREYLDSEEVASAVLVAASEAEAREAPEFQGPCIHRIFDQAGKVNCKLHGDGRGVEGCVGCGDYEQK